MNLSRSPLLGGDVTGSAPPWVTLPSILPFVRQTRQENRMQELDQRCRKQAEPNSASCIFGGCSQPVACR